MKPARRSHIWGWGALIVMLAVLHQDVWLWSNDDLVFGFMPIGLAYHAGFSIVAACLWALMVKFAWPTELERWAEQGDAPRTNPATDGQGTP